MPGFRFPRRSAPIDPAIVQLGAAGILATLVGLFLSKAVRVGALVDDAIRELKELWAKRETELLGRETAMRAERDQWMARAFSSDERIEKLTTVVAAALDYVRKGST